MRSQLGTVIAVCVCAFLGGAVVNFLFISTESRAQYNPADRITTKSLGIVHGNYSAADLAVFPDNTTKLVLRDQNGRIGMTLNVTDQLNRKKAWIEFYDHSGNLVGVLDGVQAGSGAVGRVSPGSIPRVTRRTRGGGKGDLSIVTRDEISGLWDMVYELEAAVASLTRLQEQGAP